jgi:hypothetical protein
MPQEYIIRSSFSTPISLPRLILNKTFVFIFLNTMYLHHRSASNGSLSRGAVAGIATGAIVFAVVVAVGTFSVWRRRRARATIHIENLSADTGLIEYGDEPYPSVVTEPKKDQPTRPNGEDDEVHSVDRRQSRHSEELIEMHQSMPRMHTPDAVHLPTHQAYGYAETVTSTPVMIHAHSYIRPSAPVKGDAPRHRVMGRPLGFRSTPTASLREEDDEISPDDG